MLANHWTISQFQDGDKSVS